MKFINPYSFAALRSGVVHLEDEKTYTGVIDYSLLTKTPLIIPNTTNKDTFKTGVQDHRSYDFFSYTDLSMRNQSCANEYYRPVIPGSEMRGMLRSYFEILTNSCLSMVDEKRVLAKRTSQVFLPGLIMREEEGKYKLYEAVDHLVRTNGENTLVDKHPYSDADKDYLKKSYVQSNIPEGSKVSFNKVFRGDMIKPLAINVSYPAVKGSPCEGYLLKGAPGPVITSTDPKKLRQEKHCAHVFEPTQDWVTGKLDLDILDIALDKYEKALSLSNKTVYFYNEYREEFRRFKKGLGNDYFPVYYSKIAVNSSHIMLSPAAITREISDKRLGDILRSHAPCDRVNQLCPGCQLFGTVRDSFSASSRIRFSDLEYDSGTIWKNAYEEIITLPELSSPKISNIEFYVKRPNQQTWFWTYDYYVKKDGSIRISPAEINGRKIYWHHKTIKIDANEDKGNRNMTVRPLKAEQLFRGKLFFNDITGSELNYLIYLLNAGDDDQISLADKKHGYKLGAAKPIGYGSVAIKVDSVTIRTIEISDNAATIEYKEGPYNGYIEPDIDEVIKEDYSTITAFDAIEEDEKLRYPYDKIPGDGTKPLVYEWFVSNHAAYDIKTKEKKGMANSRDQMAYKEYMKPLEKELASTGFNEECN